MYRVKKKDCSRCIETRLIQIVKRERKDATSRIVYAILITFEYKLSRLQL